jgi:hypothetical protein
MPRKSKNPLFGVAVLKLSFIMKKMVNHPGFRVVYFGTLKELSLTDSQVDQYIGEHREDLEKHIKQTGTKPG